MPRKVGPKGQIVIEKEIRDRLGVEPGWIALQRIEGDHVEVWFLPPEHTGSLKGSLGALATKRVGEGREWEDARDAAWSEAARHKVPVTD